MKYNIIPIFLINIFSFNSFGQLDSTISFNENGFRFEINYRTVIGYFYKEKDSIDFYFKTRIGNIKNYQNLKNSNVDSLGQYVCGDSIIIGNNKFEFYNVLEIIENDRENKKVQIYSSTNELVKYKMKVSYKSKDKGYGIGGFVTQFRKIIDRKKRIIIFEDVMIVGLPC